MEIDAYFTCKMHNDTQLCPNLSQDLLMGNSVFFNTTELYMLIKMYIIPVISLIFTINRLIKQNVSVMIHIRNTNLKRYQIDILTVFVNMNISLLHLSSLLHRSKTSTKHFSLLYDAQCIVLLLFCMANQEIARHRYNLNQIMLLLYDLLSRAIWPMALLSPES